MRRLSSGKTYIESFASRCNICIMFSRTAADVSLIDSSWNIGLSARTAKVSLKYFVSFSTKMRGKIGFDVRRLHTKKSSNVVVKFYSMADFLYADLELSV